MHETYERPRKESFKNGTRNCGRNGGAMGALAMTEHILSLSYGKDSMACLGAIQKLGWPLDRIVTADVWATDTIPADLPPMVEFKECADKIIKERWGSDYNPLHNAERDAISSACR